jgi:murein DD-endopeptidase MepM/ murein hydrolase activator NlpD
MPAVFAPPLPTGTFRLSSPFGPRVNPVTKEFQSLHNGLDLAAVNGTPVFAAAPGRVTTADRSAGPINGNWIKIDHGDGTSTAYLHLSRVDVNPGQTVFQGQTIGAVGSTGRSTGNHLHFIIYRGSTPTDPGPLVSWSLLTTATSAVANTAIAAASTVTGIAPPGGVGQTLGWAPWLVAGAAGVTVLLVLVKVTRSR